MGTPDKYVKKKRGSDTHFFQDSYRHRPIVVDISTVKGKRLTGQIDWRALQPSPSQVHNHGLIRRTAEDQKC